MLLAFPNLSEMPSVRCDKDRARALAERVTEPAPFVTYLAAREDLFCDESGQLGVDWRVKEVADWDRVELEEQVLRAGQRVCVIGLWDSGARAIKPAFHRTRLGVSVYPGVASKVVTAQIPLMRQLLVAALCLFALGLFSVGLPQMIGN